MWCGVCFENRYLFKNEDMGMVDGTNHFRKQVIDRHGLRQSHCKIMSLKAAQERSDETPLSRLQKKLDSKYPERFRVLFNSAHATAKQDWNLNSFTSLIELQAKNGLHVDENY